MESNTYILLSYYNYCVLKANHVIIHFRIPSKICKRLDCIIDASGILLRFPSQNRTFLVRKPYVFGSETVRFWDGERKRETA